MAAVAVVAALAAGYLFGTRRKGVRSGAPAVDVSARDGPEGAVRPGRADRRYGAAWEGKPVDVFVARIDSPESRPLGIPGATLLAVSSTGELALALGWRYIGNWESRSTLARVPISGGAPREVLEDVEDADWSPDGKELAVTRQIGDARLLEYPVGRRLYQTTGWLSRPRVSPDGKTDSPSRASGSRRQHRPDRPR